MRIPLSVGLLASLLAVSACKGPGGDGPLYNPSQANEQAPDVFRVKLETTAGDIAVLCTREWSPHGVDRFYNLVKIGFYDDVAFFRVMREPRPFVAQFGINGNPNVASRWEKATIPGEKPVVSNERGRLSFAMTADSADSRTTQVFINYSHNRALDDMGFAPICEVIAGGMSVADKLNTEYGESPDQGKIQSRGNAYLKEAHPRLDYIKKATIQDMTALSSASSAAPK